MKKLILILALMLILIAPASAILNVEKYNAEANELVVKDWWGLSDYTKVRLISNTYGCMIDCESVISITPAQDLTPVDAMKYIKFYGTGKKDFTQSGLVKSEILVEQPYEYKETIPVYKACTKDIISKNASKISSACFVENKEITKVATRMVDFYSLDKLEKGQTYIIHIQVTKPKNIWLDWVANFGGTGEFSEWLWWNASFSYSRAVNVNLTGYNIFNVNPLPIPLNISTSTEISTGKLDANCNGMAFTNYPDNNEFHYEIENKSHSLTGCNKLNTLVWVGYEEGWNSGANNSVKWYFDETETGTQNATYLWKNYTAVYHGASKGSSVNTSNILTFSGTGVTNMINESGMFGYAFRTTQNNDVMYVSGVNYFGGKANGTLEAWIKPEEAIEEDIMSEHDAGANGIFVRMNNAGGWKYYTSIRNGGADEANIICGAVNVGTWAYLGLTWNSSGTYLFYNGDLCNNATHVTPTTSSTTFRIGTNILNALSATIDEVRLSEDSKPPEYFALNWKIGQRTMEQTLGDYILSPLSIASTLNTPANQFNQTSRTMNFDCSVNASLGNTLANVTFQLWYGNGSYYQNFSIINGLVTNASIARTVSSITDGIHKWNCWVFDSGGQNVTAAANRTFRVDATAPNITILTPNATTHISFNTAFNVSINVSIADNILNLDSCWYSNTTFNQSFSCGTNITGNFSSGWNLVTVYANDTLNNIRENRTSFFVNVITQTPIYSNPVIEGSVDTIKLIVGSTSVESISGTLNYSGTIYTATVTTGTGTANLSNSISIPIVSGPTSKSFYWNITLNGNNFLSSTYSQSIVPINLTLTTDICPTGLNLSRYFTFADEENQTVLRGYSASINLRYGPSSNSSLKINNASFTNANNISICINSSYGNYSVSYGEIQYSKANYASNRHYIFSSVNLTQYNVPVILYSLWNADATSFLFTFQDSQLNYYTGYYGALLRWYPGEDVYRTSSMGKTDDIGQTIMYLALEDVDYRIALYNTDGTLIKLANPVRFTCPVAPCLYSVTVSPTSTLAYLNEWNMQKDLTWNETSKKFTLIWNDASQVAQTIRLKVLKIGGNADIIVCDNTATSYTGVLSCDCSGYVSGTFTAYAYRTASPTSPFATLIAEIITSRALQNSAGLLVAVFLITSGVLLGIWRAEAAVIITIISLIPAYVFRIVLLPVILGFVILGVIALHMMKKVS